MKITYDIKIIRKKVTKRKKLYIFKETKISGVICDTR